MGLDGTVRCRCFEEGKLRPGPVSIEDVYIDEEGGLASRMLDEARKRLRWQDFHARYGELNREFYDWAWSACEHEGGDYCDEWVSNWAGCAQFEGLVEELGGEAEFPLLSDLLPRGNGGLYPVSKAQATLDELDRFIARVMDVDEWVLCDQETDAQIWTSTNGASFPWMMGPGIEVGMNGGKVYFSSADQFFETTHFKQTPIGEPDEKGSQRMLIERLDGEGSIEVFDSIGPQDAPKVGREFYVTSEKAPFLYEGKYWTAERIRNLLVASIETGNPIRWC